MIFYRFHGRKRRYSLGTFPTVSLADARKRARKNLDKVADGADPVAEKIQLHQAGTFGELASLYLERYANKKKSRRNQRWMINRHFLPRWRHVKARDISRPEVRALVENISDKGAPILANRVLALLSKMFNFSIGRDWRTDNPCQGVEKNPEKSFKRVLTDDEMSLIRFGGHLPKGGYDVQNGITQRGETRAATVHGGVHGRGRPAGLG